MMLAAVAYPYRVVERNVVSYRRLWLVLVSAMFEPVFFLFGLGVGLGQLVGDLEWYGEPISYAQFVAPGLLASSAMNGAIFDMTFNFYYKLKESRTFDAMLVTPLSISHVMDGEMAWAMIRGGFYSVTFLGVMLAFGLVTSWWAVLMPLAALLVGIAFAAMGSYGTTFARNWQDFDILFLITQPLFLLSTTFFQLEVYPSWARPIVQLTPLYHGVDLMRDLALGSVDGSALGHVAYLVAVTVIARAMVNRRMARLLLT
ncbi:MAG: ABC transporter permease [Acidimicrobiales bacterium]|nr:ABC transporter permease [Acidimicrobiales bacterium]